ncbi:MAG: hypothetical protein L6Q54_02140 [Leptospiraceae bacterium]|nr:hypothetical protein [Leptospiraceae bacterium]
MQSKIKEKKQPIFTKADKKRRKVIIPNLYPEFSVINQTIGKKLGYNLVIVPAANEEAVELGKKYVHNDICFPAQLNTGELLLALKNSTEDRDKLAVALSKKCNACRALQYFVLVRKALDESGFEDIPIATNGTDLEDVHPGFKLGIRYNIYALQAMLYLDALYDMRQRIIPYELKKGETEEVFKDYLTKGMKAFEKGLSPMLNVLKEAVVAFNKIPHDRNVKKPVVGIVGEILVNYHPTANYNLVNYLLENGMEPWLPPILDFFRQEVVNMEEAAKHKFNTYPLVDRISSYLLGILFNYYIRKVEKIRKDFIYFSPKPDIRELSHNVEGIMEQAFNSGEGWLLPGEIIAMIKKGVKSFVIVQPFGCLPNHISGRGMIKAIKEKFQNIQILSLDYDPDISVGNIENRLQMLIMTARELVKES